MKLPILGGRLRGRWWLPASRGKILRILGGSYELEQTRLFQEWIRPGDTVLDVGAHVGYYTLLAAVLVGDTGSVWAFEPNPRNCDFLQRHVRANRLSNVQVEQAAVAETSGTARFDFGTGSGTGHLAAGGALAVRTVKLDDFCGQRGIIPAAMKIDVEGAELMVLEGAAETIGSARPTIFLSTHGDEVHHRCLEWLRERGYQLNAIGAGALDTAREVLCTPPQG